MISQRIEGRINSTQKYINFFNYFSFQYIFYYKSRQKLFFLCTAKSIFATEGLNVIGPNQPFGRISINNHLYNLFLLIDPYFSAQNYTFKNMLCQHTKGFSFKMESGVDSQTSHPHIFFYLFCLDRYNFMIYQFYLIQNILQMRSILY